VQRIIDHRSDSAAQAHPPSRYAVIPGALSIKLKLSYAQVNKGLCQQQQPSQSRILHRGAAAAAYQQFCFALLETGGAHFVACARRLHTTPPSLVMVLYDL